MPWIQHFNLAASLHIKHFISCRRKYKRLNSLTTVLTLQSRKFLLMFWLCGRKEKWVEDRGLKGAECQVLGWHCCLRSVPIVGVLLWPFGQSRPWSRDQSTQKKYAQSQFTRPYINLYRPHISGWVYFWCMIVQIPTGIGPQRLFCHTEIFNWC